MTGVFADLAGQDAVVAQREKAAAAAALLAGHRSPAGGDRGGRPPGPAQPGAMTHAWLFTGPPGSGRSVAARAFAMALLCPSGGCGQCASCHQVRAGTHADLMLIRPEGLSYGVKQTRDLVLRAAGAPAGGRWQVVVFEDADRCTEQAANALLKAIEEPVARTVWLLCAPSPEDLVPTIRSRCRVVTLVVPASAAVAKVLVTRDGIEPAAALAAARAAQGHVGRARRLAPRRLDLLQRAASRLRHADDDPDETDGAERCEQPEGVALPDRLHDRQEESADQERRAPVDRRRHRNGPAANLTRIDLVDDCPCNRASGECE